MGQEHEGALERGGPAGPGGILCHLLAFPCGTQRKGGCWSNPLYDCVGSVNWSIPHRNASS